jgi:small subunit ribosomal protein S3
MGNKTNATAMRIGVNKNWKSIWYQPKNTYADTLLEDLKVRELIEEKLKNASVAKLTIKRSMNRMMVDVSVARPGVVIGKGGSGIEELKSDLQKLTKTDVRIKVLEVKRPEIQAKLIGENVASQCERRMNPKRAIQKAAEAAMNTGLIKGVTIWVSGRIRGAEIARTERVELGTVPRHTLRADIDYASVRAQVPYLGAHGIKVWVNKGEKNDYEISDQ